MTRLAFLGPPGTWGELAAMKFAPEAELLPFPSHAAVAWPWSRGWRTPAWWRSRTWNQRFGAGDARHPDPRDDTAYPGRVAAADRAQPGRAPGDSSGPGEGGVLPSAGAGAVPEVPGTVLSEGAGRSGPFDDGGGPAGDAATGRCGGNRDGARSRARGGGGHRAAHPGHGQQCHAVLDARTGASATDRARPDVHRVHLRGGPARGTCERTAGIRGGRDQTAPRSRAGPRRQPSANTCF